MLIFTAVVGIDICPSNYIVHNSFCYHFSSNTQKWSNSKTTCEDHGSTLSSVTNEGEMNFLIRKNKSAELTLDSLR